MSLLSTLARLVRATGYSVEKIADNVYDQDGLRTRHNHSFMNDPAFAAAYQRGVQAAERHYRWRWRVHVGLWAAFAASKLEGDFIECGVNHGFLSSAIMRSLDWDATNKTFYLLGWRR